MTGRKPSGRELVEFVGDQVACELTLVGRVERGSAERVPLDSIIGEPFSDGRGDRPLKRRVGDCAIDDGHRAPPSATRSPTSPQRLRGGCPASPISVPWSRSTRSCSASRLSDDVHGLRRPRPDRGRIGSDPHAIIGRPPTAVRRRGPGAPRPASTAARPRAPGAGAPLNRPVRLGQRSRPAAPTTGRHTRSSTSQAAARGCAGEPGRRRPRSITTSCPSSWGRAAARLAARCAAQLRLFGGRVPGDRGEARGHRRGEPQYIGAGDARTGCAGQGGESGRAGQLVASSDRPPVGVGLEEQAGAARCTSGSRWARATASAVAPGDPWALLTPMSATSDPDLHEPDAICSSHLLSEFARKSQGHDHGIGRVHQWRDGLDDSGRSERDGLLRRCRRRATPEDSTTRITWTATSGASPEGYSPASSRRPTRPSPSASGTAVTATLSVIGEAASRSAAANRPTSDRPVFEGDEPHPGRRHLGRREVGLVEDVTTFDGRREHQGLVGCWSSRCATALRRARTRRRRGFRRAAPGPAPSGRRVAAREQRRTAATRGCSASVDDGFASGRPPCRSSLDRARPPSRSSSHVVHPPIRTMCAEERRDRQARRPWSRRITRRAGAHRRVTPRTAGRSPPPRASMSLTRTRRKGDGRARRRARRSP